MPEPRREDEQTRNRRVYEELRAIRNTPEQPTRDTRQLADWYFGWRWGAAWGTGFGICVGLLLGRL